MLLIVASGLQAYQIHPPNILRSMVPRPCGPLCPRRSDAGHVLPTAQSQKTGSKTSFGRFTQGARTTDVNRESSICRYAIPTVRFGDVPTTGSTTWPERVRRSAAVRSARYMEPAIDADERSTKVCWDGYKSSPTTYRPGTVFIVGKPSSSLRGIWNSHSAHSSVIGLYSSRDKRQ
jgi:hypothetical protein